MVVIMKVAVTKNICCYPAVLSAFPCHLGSSCITSTVVNYITTKCYPIDWLLGTFVSPWHVSYTSKLVKILGNNLCKSSGGSMINIYREITLHGWGGYQIYWKQQNLCFFQNKLNLHTASYQSKAQFPHYFFHYACHNLFIFNQFCHVWVCWCWIS